MQFTGPIFLFVFLPLSFPLVFAFPRHRPAVISAISVLWYVLANFSNPLGILHLFSQVGVLLALSYLPRTVTQKRIVTAVGIALIAVSFFGARVLVEYTSIAYPYPQGLAVVSLLGISFLADLSSGRAREAAFFERLSYLLFYPVLACGPVIGFSEYLSLSENARPSLPRFCEGLQIYIGGFVKRVAVAALMFRTLEELFTSSVTAIPVPIRLFSLPVAFFLAYFFLTGILSMAQGIALMYGYEVARDYDPLFSKTMPDDMPRGLFLSFERFLRTYIAAPIEGCVKGRGGRVLAVVASSLLVVFFFRLRAELLLFALPVIVFSAVRAWRETPLDEPKGHLSRFAIASLSSLFIMVFTVALILPQPFSFFSIYFGPAPADRSYDFYRLYATLSGAKYLLVGTVGLLLYLPIVRGYDRLKTTLRGGAAVAFRVTASLMLLLGFVFTLIYYAPQFPIYAERAFARLYI